MSKIALPIAELKPALTGFSKVIQKRCTLPVLNHLKIERTKDGWIAITATDLDHFVTVRLEQPAQGEPVSLLVPYDELLKIVKNCPKDDTLLIRCGENQSELSVIVEYPIGNQVTEAKVSTLPVEEFPEIPRIKGEAVTVNDALRASIHEAIECASTDATRQILNGAFIDISKPDQHYIVGTDGRHLFSSNSFSLPLKESVIIPTHKFLGWKEFNNDGEWQLKVSPKPEKDEPVHLQLSSRRWRFITRQYEGSYPNWRQVVPEELKTTVHFDAANAQDIIRTIQRLPDHDPVNHGLGIEMMDQRVNLLCRPNIEVPWIPVEIADATTEGPDVTVHLNRQLLIKALQFGLLRLDIIDALSPIRFSHEGRQIIIMTIRTDVVNKPIPIPASAPRPTAEPEIKPVAPSTAAQPQTTMPKNTNGTNGTNGHEPTTEKSALEKALEQVETVKASIKTAVGGLNDLLATLKQVQREQKSTDKEVQSVRSTLEKLQSVKI